jgi:hypothetical protein
VRKSEKGGRSEEEERSEEEVERGRGGRTKRKGERKNERRCEKEV